MQCSFCGRDPYHYVDNGCGMERVAVTCCEIMSAISDKTESDGTDFTITIGELRSISSKIARLQARNDAYEEKYGEIWQEEPADPSFAKR